MFVYVSIILVPPGGFEPPTCPNLEPLPRYKLGVLPLNYRGVIWLRMTESNRRSGAYETPEIPLLQSAIECNLYQQQVHIAIDHFVLDLVCAKFRLGIYSKSYH